MTEPPRAAGGRREEGWARKAFAVGFSSRLAGGSRAGAWQGCERVGSAPALPRSRPYSVRARWWASGASRFRDDGTPMGRGWAPCRGLGP